MKRMTAFLTSIMLITCITAFPVQAEDTGGNQMTTVADKQSVVEESTQQSDTELTAAVQIGDINSDGEVDVTDAISLQKYLLKMTSYNVAQYQAADLNHDDAVDVFDLGLLKRTLLHTFEDERPGEEYEKFLEGEFVKELWYQGDDGVIYFSDDCGDVQFDPYVPNPGTCDRSYLLLALMYKYPDSKFAAQINSWCEDREAEHAYLRENGVDFTLVQEGVHEIMFAVLNAEQLDNFPVYETAGYQIGLSKKYTADQNE